MRIRSLPVTGGPATTDFTYVAPGEVTRVFVYGTPAQAAAIVLFGDAGDRSRLLLRAPDGTWHVSSPGARASLRDVQLDGGRVFTFEIRNRRGEPVAVVRDPAPRDLPYESYETRFAGDRVVWVQRGAGDEGDTVLSGDWRTGALLDSIKLEEASVADLALRPDGRIVASTLGNGVVELAPGQPPRRIGAPGGSVELAGENVVVQHDDGLTLIAPGTGERAFGLRTETMLDPFDADERHVLWNANGCLLVADVTDPEADDPGPGPCARYEATEETVRALRSRWPIKLTCVSGKCRGVLRLSLRGRRVGRPVRFRVPGGAHRIVYVRFTRAELARLRRAATVTADTGDGSPTQLLL